MVNLGSNSLKIIGLSADEAFTFIELTEGRRLIDYGKGLKSYGVYSGKSELIGVGLFCNPRTSELQQRYTSEIFHLSPGLDKSCRVQLIRHHMATGIWDLFSLDRSEGDTYSESGMKFVKRGSDLLYEWRNPQINFYTYKLMTKSNENYYIGRHVIALEHPTEDQCMADGYLGSGGKKFKKWLLELGDQSLVRKEVIGIHSTWEDVLIAERNSVGDLHKTDPLCLNSVAGGAWIGFGSLSRAQMLYSACLVHGETLHRGKTCLKCVVRLAVCESHGKTNHEGKSCIRCKNDRAYKLGDCDFHGETVFHGNSCSRCLREKSKNVEKCAIHGLVKHRGEQCETCLAKESAVQKFCPTHGETLHKGNSCNRCVAKATYELRECEIHGPVIHQGDLCRTCFARDAIYLENCSTHGEVKFRSGRCLKCVRVPLETVVHCSVHGDSLHRGGSCISCDQLKRVYLANCPNHGLVNHCKGVCYSCRMEKTVTMKNCSIHGATKHHGDTCSKCSSPALHEAHCSIHGETVHRAKKCLKCRVSKATKMRTCGVHGLTNYRGDSCMKCGSKSATTKLSCSIHGESFHRGKNCMKCSAARRKDRNFSEGNL